MKENIKIRCVHCKQMKTKDEFSWSNKNKEIRNNRCKECQKNYSKKHYIKNKNNYLDNQRLNRDRNKKFICDYLIEHPCIDCGEKNIIVLQFDHKNPLKKENYYNTISQGITDKWSINKLKLEIEKCDVRCANCHIKRHAKENNNYKYNYY
jgi:DUF4097 and DUF4098 domain-containing protein YvlB